MRCRRQQLLIVQFLVLSTILCIFFFDTFTEANLIRRIRARRRRRNNQNGDDVGGGNNSDNDDDEKRERSRARSAARRRANRSSTSVQIYSVQTNPLTGGVQLVQQQQQLLQPQMQLQQLLQPQLQQQQPMTMMMMMPPPAAPSLINPLSFMSPSPQMFAAADSAMPTLQQGMMMNNQPMTTFDGTSNLMLSGTPRSSTSSVLSSPSTVTSSSRGQCPSDYILHTLVQRCFKVVTRPQRWSVAEGVCNDDGGTLIRIDSALKQQSMAELLSSDLSRQFFMRGVPVIGRETITPTNIKKNRRKPARLVRPSKLSERKGTKRLPTRGITSTQGGLTAFWIGGNDISVESELSWPTNMFGTSAADINNNPLTRYTNFADETMLPRRAAKRGRRESFLTNCVATFATLNFRWVAGNCERELAFICEVAPSTTSVPRRRSLREDNNDADSDADSGGTSSSRRRSSSSDGGSANIALTAMLTSAEALSSAAQAISATSASVALPALLNAFTTMLQQQQQPAAQQVTTTTTTGGAAPQTQIPTAPTSSSLLQGRLRLPPLSSGGSSSSMNEADISMLLNQALMSSVGANVADNTNDDDENDDNKSDKKSPPHKNTPVMQLGVFFNTNNAVQTTTTTTTTAPSSHNSAARLENNSNNNNNSKEENSTEDKSLADIESIFLDPSLSTTINSNKKTARIAEEQQEATVNNSTETVPPSELLLNPNSRSSIVVMQQSEKRRNTSNILTPYEQTISDGLKDIVNFVYDDDDDGGGGGDDDEGKKDEKPDRRAMENNKTAAAGRESENNEAEITTAAGLLNLLTTADEAALDNFSNNNSTTSTLNLDPLLPSYNIDNNNSSSRV